MAEFYFKNLFLRTYFSHETKIFPLLIWIPKKCLNFDLNLKSKTKVWSRKFRSKLLLAAWILQNFIPKKNCFRQLFYENFSQNIAAPRQRQIITLFVSVFQAIFLAVFTQHKRRPVAHLQAFAAHAVCRIREFVALETHAVFRIQILKVVLKPSDF